MFRRIREPKRLLPKPPNRFVKYWVDLPLRIRDGWKESWRETRILYAARRARLKRTCLHILDSWKKSVRETKIRYVVLYTARWNRFKRAANTTRDWFLGHWREYSILWQSKMDPVAKWIETKKKQLYDWFRDQWRKSKQADRTKDYGVLVVIAFIATVLVLWRKYDSIAWRPDWSFWLFWGKIAALVVIVGGLSYMFWKKRTWRDKGVRHWRLALKVTAGLVIIFLGYRAYRWSEAREIRAGQIATAKAEQKARQEVEKRKSEKELAIRLRSAVVVPDVVARGADITFVYSATESDSTIFRVGGEKYCTRVEPENQAHSFDITTQDSTFEIRPWKPVQRLGPVEFFTLRSYGAPTTDVRVWVYKASRGRCGDPKKLRYRETKLPARVAGSFSFSLFSPSSVYPQCTAARVCRTSPERD